MTIALVTGTSSGIGLATAIRLATDGHRVKATMRDPGRAGELLAAAAAAGVEVEVEELDVNDDESVTAAFERVGPVDILVNNAGMSPVGAVEEFPISEWKAMFETNVFGLIRCTQAALVGMRKRASGHIVNISSITGRTAIPMFGPYSSSKWAVEAISETLATEAAIFGIRVTIVEPGAVATPIRGKTGAPDRNSPYRPVAKNWGFSVGYDHARARGPEEVAATISTAIADPTSPLRITVGSGIDELFELRRRQTDEEWVDLWSADTGQFLERFRGLTGTDLTEPVSQPPE
jgi:NAD(P)-dependent dehydrogenase (short-subunit alcohol dehydrogenase family)